MPVSFAVRFQPTFALAVLTSLIKLHQQGLLVLDTGTLERPFGRSCNYASNNMPIFCPEILSRDKNHQPLKQGMRNSYCLA